MIWPLPWGMDRFPKLPHQSAGCGTECCSYIVPAELNSRHGSMALRCKECGLVVGTINTGILIDLVNLALATEMDKFIPDADHINALPGPLRRYIHDLETRADPAGDVAEIALLKENNAALWARVRELEAQVPPADPLKHSMGTLTNPVTSWVIIADPYLPLSLLRHAAANFL
jgi:hypothetical protein